MTTLNINGYRVQISDSFVNLSPERQEKAVGWILSHVSPDDHPSAKNIGRSPVTWSVVQ